MVDFGPTLAHFGAKSGAFFSTVAHGGAGWRETMLKWFLTFFQSSSLFPHCVSLGRYSGVSSLLVE